MADNLTVDYKKLLKLTVAQRVDMARSQLGQTYLSSLTPSQYAALFPDYYKKFVPSYSSLGGGGGGAAAGTTGGGGAAGGGGAGGGGASTSEAGTTYSPPTQSSAVTPPWFQKFEQDVLSKTGQSPQLSGAKAGAVDRSKFFNELKDPEVRKLFATMLQAEVGGDISESHQAFAEKVFNRATIEKKTLRTLLNDRNYFEPYQNGTFNRAKRTLESNPSLVDRNLSMIDSVAREGTDRIKGATHNASGSVAEAVRGGKPHPRYKDFNSVKESILQVGKETYYYKTFEVEQIKNLPRIKSDYPTGATSAATGILQQGGGETGAVMPGGKPSLGPSGPTVGVPVDEKSLKEANKNRPEYMSGRIRIGEGEGAFTAPAGSGGRSGKFPSVPYTIEKLDAMRAPGPRLGSTFDMMRGRGKTGVVDVPIMFDPIARRNDGGRGRNREGIQIHPAIAPRDINGDDIKDLISEGCIAVDPAYYDQFMESYKKYYKENNGQVWFVNVPNPNGQHEWVITNKKPEGNVYTPQQAIDSQKKTGEPIPEVALPPGLNQGIVNHFKNLGPEDRMDFVKKLQAYGEGGIQRINELYDQHIASLPEGEREKAEKGIVEVVKTEGAPKAFSSAEEEAKYYQDLLSRAEEIGGVEIDSNLKGRGWCGKGSRGLAGALLNDNYFNKGLGEGGDSRAASLSSNNRYFQDSGYYNERVSVSDEQIKDKDYLNSLPIGTVISSQGGGKGDGHVQVKIGPNQWTSDVRQGNKVLGGYTGYAVHTPNEAGIKKLDPRIVSDTATLEWAKNQGYSLSDAQQTKVEAQKEPSVGQVMPEPTLGPTTPTVPETAYPTNILLGEETRYEIAGQPVQEGQSLTQEQIQAIGIAKDMDNKNYQNYPEHVRKQYEKQINTSKGTATPTPSSAPSPAPTASPVNPPATKAVTDAMAQNKVGPDHPDFKDYRDDPAVKAEAATAPETAVTPEKVPELAQGGIIKPKQGENITAVNQQGEPVAYLNDREALRVEPASTMTAEERKEDITNFASDQSNPQSKQENRIESPKASMKQVLQERGTPNTTFVDQTYNFSKSEERTFADAKDNKSRPGFRWKLGGLYHA